MTCGISDEALEMLVFLINKRKVSHKRTMAINGIRARWRSKGVDVDNVLHELINWVPALVGKKKTEDRWGYWVNLGEALRILKAHGREVPR